MNVGKIGNLLYMTAATLMTVWVVGQMSGLQVDRNYSLPPNQRIPFIFLVGIRLSLEYLICNACIIDHFGSAISSLRYI